VQGIAEACIPDPDRLLRELLTEAIRDAAASRGPDAGQPIPAADVVSACRPTAPRDDRTRSDREHLLLSEPRPL
jgi:hypothetical protein